MPADRKPTEDEPKIEGAPALSSTDWDAVAGEEVEASEIFENGDIRYEEDADDPTETSTRKTTTILSRRATKRCPTTARNARSAISFWMTRKSIVR